MLLYARPLAELLEQLERLPGIGPKSAQRLAFHLLQARRDEVDNLARAMINVRDRVGRCSRCGNFSEGEVCGICSDPRREDAVLCVVAEARDLMAVERSGEFRGRYHVLGGVMNPMEGVGPAQLTIDHLMRRVAQENVTEVILALSATVEGETTANYLGSLLKPRGVRATQLARGLPFGGDLDYADQMTIAGAMKGRREI